MKKRHPFITDQGLYCYKAMLFGIKNTSAMYQLSQIMEVYVNDLLVKSKRLEQHLANLQEAFTVLRCYKMKFNPLKCTFGVESRKFLGHMISK